MSKTGEPRVGDQRQHGTQSVIAQWLNATLLNKTHMTGNLSIPLRCVFPNDSRRTIYISTDGAGSIPNEFLGQLKNVVVAYDNDEPGNLMAQRVISQLPNAVRKLPKANDWNSELVNRFNWSKESRSKEIQKQPQHEWDGGLSL